MTSNYTSDAKRTAILQGNDPHLHDQLLKDFSENLDAALSEQPDVFGRNVFVLNTAFTSLQKWVQSPKFKPTTALQLVFDKLVRNLLEAQPIWMGDEKACNDVLKAIYTEGVAYGVVRKMVRDKPHIDVKVILDESLELLWDAVKEGRLGGRATLKTFYVSICKLRVWEALREGTTTEKDGLSVRHLKKIVLGDDYIFDNQADVDWADTTIQLVEKEATELLCSKLVRRAVLKLTPKCRKALILQYYFKLSMDEIAYKLNIEKQTAKNEAKRCRDKLREILSAQPEVAAFLKSNY